jgi:hypothetical protein
MLSPALEKPQQQSKLETPQQGTNKTGLQPALPGQQHANQSATSKKPHNWA